MLSITTWVWNGLKEFFKFSGELIAVILEVVIEILGAVIGD